MERKVLLEISNWVHKWRVLTGNPCRTFEMNINLFHATDLLITPENIKARGFLMFSGGIKEISGIKWVDWLEAKLHFVI